MIYTVTFNPSLDYLVEVPDFRLGRTNRTVREHLFPGGKGINVSIVLRALGVPSTALGFLAGFTGAEIDRSLRDLGIGTRFFTLPEGLSRINLKLQSIDGTEINGMGPPIPPAAREALLAELDKLRAGDALVLAGSIPADLPPDIYRDILARLAGRGVLTVVDATRDLLTNVLEHGPFLIKPNNHELGELFGVELSTREAVVPYAQALRARGARNVLVSMAGQGAVLVAETGQVFSAPAPKGQLVSGVGAGDSMVAGFLAGFLGSGSYEEAFRLGLAAGSASAFCQHLATGDGIRRVLAQLQ